MKTAYIFLAEGFETIEALGPADVLRRGGVDTKLVSAQDEPFVMSSQKVAVGVDLMLEELDAQDIDGSDVLIFPGGMPGSKNLAANKTLIKLMTDHYKNGGTVAAICAAPGLVAGQLSGLDSKIFTCFDGFEDGPKSKGAIFVKKPAVTCDNLITGRSAGWCVNFGLEILAAMTDEATVAKVKGGMLLSVE